ncbi:hypothetical protein RND71_027828 [Anisodus tanguticus]|uniref:Uncharacterized protein n=1 Tax=Anisodus tanguticus TaxID=243964 RepID=A0AAE1RHC6_9SOLA|nr:hypothetical protein RND71_027828 [Anisodus tanguticus]
MSKLLQQLHRMFDSCKHLLSVGVDSKRHSTEDVVRSFSIAKSGARTSLDDHNDLTGDIVVKSGMRKSFDVFRGTLKEFELKDFFRASCFGYFLELPVGIVARFPMKIVYELMKCCALVACPDSWKVINVIPCFFVTLESESNALIDQFKVELDGVTTITRESSDVDGAGGDGGVVDDAGVGDVVGVDVGGGGGVDDVVTYGDGARDDDDFHGGFSGGVGGYTLLSSRFSYVGVGTSSVPSCACQCETCKKRMNELIKKIEELSKAQIDNNTLIHKLISKRGVNLSKRLLEPYTPIEFRKNWRAITKALANISSRKSA